MNSRSRRINVALLCVGACVLSVPSWMTRAVPAAEPQRETGPRSAVGANLDFVVDWSSEVPFVDLFKTARDWIPQQAGREWGEGPELKLTEDGHWIRSLAPGQYATTLICGSRGVKPGKYVCLYQGTGVLDFEGRCDVVNSAPGRLMLVVDPGDSILLHVRATDPADPVRDIHVVPAAYEGTFREQPFNPLFLEQKSLYSVLRYKDWQKTDNSTLVGWSERPLVDDPSQARRGVAIGWMVRLSNTLGADPWFCMPHQADDDYVRRFAQEVAASLDPNRTVYLEYSNEVWNTIFEQSRYAMAQGQRLRLPGDEFQAGLAFYSQRAAEVFAIWKEVFAGSGRLVCVIAGQADNPWVSEQMLQYNDTYRHADALAIAPYFGHEFGVPENAARVDRLTVSDAIEVCRRDLPRLRADIEANAAIAGRFQRPLIAYEGGQHLWALNGAENNKRFTDLIIAANRDPRMSELYATHLADWKSAGGQLYVVYKSVAAPDMWGAWGLLEYEGQSPAEAPKYQAVRQFAEQNPPWW